ncbi:MAG: hypothetical protein ACRESZ_13785 [Methylococcales bacterium]
MLKIELTEEEIKQLYRQFMKHHSAGAVKRKSHVVKCAYRRWWAALCASHLYWLVSALLPRDSLKTHFQAHPPHTVSQASHEIEKLTGIKLSLSACRNFIRKRLGMKCRKMAGIPCLKLDAWFQLTRGSRI